MSNVLILVEGQTEETFVRDILGPYLWNFNVFCTPKVATTKRVATGPDFKGGIVSYGKLKFDIKRLLEDSSIRLVTTMIDYYGFSSRVPFKNKISGSNCFQRVKILEKLFAADIGDRRFSPYLQMHEFEAMIFVEPGELDKVSHTLTSRELLETRNKFKSPEEINDNPCTAPSKLIIRAFPSYRKTVHGPLIIRRIGLEKIRRQCEHFNQWISKLEKLGGK
jgi:hypothetical protein